jgi:hypothetical protein
MQEIDNKCFFIGLQIKKLIFCLSIQFRGTCLFSACARAPPKVVKQSGFCKKIETGRKKKGLSIKRQPLFGLQLVEVFIRWM